MLRVPTSTPWGIVEILWFHVRMTPIAERALSGHHGVPDWMAARCADIMRLMVVSSGITMQAGYGMRASEYVGVPQQASPAD